MPSIPLSKGDKMLYDKITKNITRFYSETELCSNVYLLESEGKTLLIDSGSGALDFDFAPDRCILTHAHFDHSLGVKDAWESVLLHNADIEYCKAVPAYLARFFHLPGQSRQLPEGKMEFGSFELEVVHTPGHTNGSVCIFETRSGILFSGDTLFADGAIGRTDIGGNESQIMESLEKISKLKWPILCPGHGPIEKSTE